MEGQEERTLLRTVLWTSEDFFRYQYMLLRPGQWKEHFEDILLHPWDKFVELEQFEDVMVPFPYASISYPTEIVLFDQIVEIHCGEETFGDYGLIAKGNSDGYLEFICNMIIPVDIDRVESSAFRLNVPCRYRFDLSIFFCGKWRGWP